MNYGRFTDMTREDVIAYFEGNGFAVSDEDTTDELRAAAHIDCPEPVNEDTDTGPMFRVYQVAHMNETGPGGVPVTLATMWTIAMTLGPDPVLYALALALLAWLLRDLRRS